MNNGLKSIDYQCCIKQLPAGRPVFAAETSKQQEQPDYASQKAVQAFIDDLVENEQFKRSELESIIGQAHRVDRVLELISRPSRETSDLERLSQDFYDPGAYPKGIAFWKDHAETTGGSRKEIRCAS